MDDAIKHLKSDPSLLRSGTHKDGNRKDSLDLTAINFLNESSALLNMSNIHDVSCLEAISDENISDSPPAQVEQISYPIVEVQMLDAQAKMESI